MKIMTRCATIFVLFSVFSSVDARAEAGIRAGRPCEGAARDGNVWWSGLEHDSFKATYRSRFGAVTTEQGRVRLRFRTCLNDVEAVRMAVWDDRLDTRTWWDLQSAETAFDPELGPIQYWQLDLATGSQPTILWYFFELRDGGDTDFYVDDDLRSFPGGLGAVSDDLDDKRSFQLTVYDAAFKVPDWAQGAIVYSIFPDRFRNGDASNDPVDRQGWIYGQQVRKLSWEQPLCDPESATCPDERYNQFYGGDLAGIREKLGDLEALGVSVVYLNPIFASPTNHRYDTTDFKKIDPALGDLQAFKDLVAEGRRRGIRILLDGVFNHASVDSPYFDYFGRWDASLSLTSPFGPGTNDRSGACESPESPYRSWFYFPDIGNPALYRDRETVLRCPNGQLAGSHGPFLTYEAWFSFYNVPKINTRLDGVRDFFYRADDSVARYWVQQGAGGWRLDVGADIDAGWTKDPGNQYWEEFRVKMRASDPDAWIVGEEWGNGTPWLLGREWDSVMNYRLRAALLNWAFDECSGRGCQGRSFVENDSNPGSPTGSIFATSESQLATQLDGIRESYPAPSWHSALNLLGSHDTNRVLFLLKKISGDDSERAKAKLRFLASFLMTYPGAPSIYYGDEAGLAPEGIWKYETWIDDPYNRAAFPWADRGLQPDTGLQAHFRRLGRLRRDNEVLAKGDFEWLRVDDAERVVSYRRFLGRRSVIVALNRGDLARNVVVSAPTLRDFEGGAFRDSETGIVYRVADGRLDLGQVPSLGARILLPE
jgi:glycosidase